MASSIYITYVDKEGPFLKIWGQTERNSSVYVEKNLQQLLPQFEQGLYTPSPGSIQVGVLCCAKYKDGLFYRARIANIINQNVVEVHFIDFGNKDMIPVANIRSMANIPGPLLSVPPQAKDFIMAGIMQVGQSWHEHVLAVINSEIRYMDLQWGPIGTAGNYTLINLYRNGEDITLDFLARGLVCSVNLASQQQILFKFSGGIPNLHSPVGSIGIVPSISTNQVPVQPTLLTYKLFSLEIGSEHDVYVSYVSDGPCHFSLQLQKLEDTLTRLMKEINRMPLQPLEDHPLPGTVCVARCTEDNHICRAVVTSVVDNMYKVFYVDFGNTELLTIDSLYQIPFKFVIPKVMAMRYALAGLDRSSVTLEMKCAFKEFVKEKLLHMRVLPAPARSALPLCELWDDTGVNVLDVIRIAALVAYPEPVQLTRGFSQEVKVSFVYSCNRFYVQLKSKEEDLQKVMSELQIDCPNKPPLTMEKISVGQPCCALFESDGLWYRAQVISIEDNMIKVLYVDYGNEETVPLRNLRIPQGEFLTALRPQALECCLNGYQKMECDFERDSFLEELILEKEFTMKVVEMQGNKALIDLTDVARYNVASLLLEKLASAHSQASPLLIQDGNKVEQRKRSNPSVNAFEARPRTENSSSFGRDPGRKPFGNREQNSKSWGQRFNENNGASSSDNWSNDGADDRNNWRQRKPPVRDNRNRQENSFSNRDHSNEEWDDKGAAVEKNKFQRNKENRSTNSWNNQERGNRDKWKGHEIENKSNKNKRFSYDQKNVKSVSKSPNFSGSEKSFSDTSEKNWRSKSQHSNFRNDNRRERPGGKGGFNKEKTSWNSPVKQKPLERSPEPLDVAPPDASYPVSDLLDKTEEVSVCWFYDPAHFFLQLQSFKTEFRTMMETIQSRYQNRPPCSNNLSIGSPVIALFPEDGVLYRAQITDRAGLQWKVQYVDFGNVTVTEKIWPIEKKFLELPAQAVCCGLALAPPTDNTWPEPDAYASFFGKDMYICNFSSFDSGKYVVEIYDNLMDIAEILKSASLAKALEPDIEFFEVKYPPTAELPLLFDQQIRVILSSVNTLNDFVVVLPNGQEVGCYLCNVSTAENTWEDTLKCVVGYTIIVHITDVTEDKLEVVVYDSTGAKLKLVEPDEGTLEWVPYLCHMPVLVSTVPCCVTHITEKGAFIQPFDFADTVTQLLDSLFNNYENTVQEQLPQVQEGFIFAVHSADGNWYRGQVTAVEDDKVTVLYIDYGNLETVNVSEIRDLKCEHTELHMLALEVLLTEPVKQLPENEVIITVWYGEGGWEGEITSKEPHENEKTNRKTIGIPVILSHCDFPNEFYIQLQESLDQIETLQNSLQEQVANLQDIENPSAGVLCAAQYSLDGVWYRCQVLDADSDITSVRFVDYGNTDVLDNNSTKVKTLPPDLLSLEQYAQRCSLCLSPDGAEEWTQAALDSFERHVNVEDLSMKIVHQDEKTTYVELFTNGEKISEKLLAEGLAKEMSLETESSCTGYISHLNSPAEFWIQLENCVGDLERIAEQLSTAEKFPELEDFAPGSLCAALYPEDEMWYRARILSNTVAGLEVVFVDYGNSCTCNGLRQLPEDLILLPPLALKCSLNKPNGIVQWSPQATEKFREISAEGASIFKVHKITTGETSIVDLLLNDEKITEKLLPETEEGYVSHFESLDEIWIQKSADKEKLEELCERMVEAPDWTPLNNEIEGESEELVAAQFVDDEVWYRAKILEKVQGDGGENMYRVLFVDYGNTSETENIRELPEDVKKEPWLAVKCKLGVLPGHKWTEESSELFATINNEGTTAFQVEFVNDDTIRLYLEQRDIRTDLNPIPLGSTTSTPKKSIDSIQGKNIVAEESEMLEVVNEIIDGIDVSNEKNIKTDENFAKGIVEELCYNAVENEEEDEHENISTINSATDEETSYEKAENSSIDSNAEKREKEPEVIVGVKEKESDIYQDAINVFSTVESDKNVEFEQETDLTQEITDTNAAIKEKEQEKIVGEEEKESDKYQDAINVSSTIESDKNVKFEQEIYLTQEITDENAEIKEKDPEIIAEKEEKQSDNCQGAINVSSTIESDKNVEFEQEIDLTQEITDENAEIKEKDPEIIADKEEKQSDNYQDAINVSSTIETDKNVEFEQITNLKENKTAGEETNLTGDTKIEEKEVKNAVVNVEETKLTEEIQVGKEKQKGEVIKVEEKPEEINVTVEKEKEPKSPVADVEEQTRKETVEAQKDSDKQNENKEEEKIETKNEIEKCIQGIEGDTAIKGGEEAEKNVKGTTKKDKCDEKVVV